MSRGGGASLSSDDLDIQTAESQTRNGEIHKPKQLPMSSGGILVIYVTCLAPSGIWDHNIGNHSDAVLRVDERFGLHFGLALSAAL